VLLRFFFSTSIFLFSFSFYFSFFSLSSAAWFQRSFLWFRQVFSCCGPGKNEFKKISFWDCFHPHSGSFCSRIKYTKNPSW
jgi:hypothetical protein